LATGDGGPDHPYLATYSTDEHDLLRALGLRARGQELVRHGSGRFDVISCEDGSEIWFDVTESVTCIGPVVERHAAVLGGDG
jgi:hypothetical protein